MSERDVFVMIAWLLLDGTDRFPDGELTYECWPDAGEYNSNSFAHGLAHYAGFEIPQYFHNMHWRHPGLNPYIPRNYFAPQ